MKTIQLLTIIYLVFTGCSDGGLKLKVEYSPLHSYQRKIVIDSKTTSKYFGNENKLAFDDEDSGQNPNN
jgi:hypothetical protein